MTCLVTNSVAVAESSGQLGQGRRRRRRAARRRSAGSNTTGGSLRRSASSVRCCTGVSPGRRRWDHRSPTVPTGCQRRPDVAAHPLVILVPMEPSSTVQLRPRRPHARRSEARRRRLVAPSFRCPPRLVGVDRSLRRRPGGGVVVGARARAAVGGRARRHDRGGDRRQRPVAARGHPAAHRAVGAARLRRRSDGQVA